MSKHARLGMAILLVAVAAQAHKITGTDIATLTQLQVDHNGVAGTYELQYGELAGLDERRRMDTDGDGRIAAAELEAYIAQQRERLGANLSMEADGQPLPVQLAQGEVLPDEPLVAPAQMTLRYQLVAQAPEFTQRHTLVVRDANQFPRLVHADISVEGMPLVDIDQAVPRQGALKQIRVQAPEAPVEAAIALKPSELLWQSGAFASSQAMLGTPQTATSQQISSSTDRLKAMLRSDRLSFGLIVFALGLSIFLGAVHALEPGHGKTIVAAYLIGSRGTVANAIFLGGVVTFTHTLSVIVLGVITLFASRYILPEQIFPWLGASSGLLIVGLGIWLFVRNLTGRGHRHGPFGHQHTHLSEEHDHDQAHDEEHDHDHPHDHDHSHPHDHHHDGDRDHDHEHDHSHEHPHDHGEDHGHPHDHTVAHDHPHPHDHGDDHDQAHPHDHPLDREDDHVLAHDHDHDHGHSHVPQGKMTLGSLLALGISGGIVPCPGALVILLLAVALHRIAFGLTLIVTFSLGLAAVLIAIGILMVKARPLMDRFSGEGRLVRALPIVSSVVIIGVGLAMAIRSLMEAGILIVNL